jgi:hypothetical protein
MLKNMAGMAAAVLAIFALGLAVGLLSFHLYQSRTAGGFSGPALVQKVQTLSQLVTVKYTLEKVVQFDDVKWYGESRVLLVAHGVVKAGIDLGQITPADIRVSGAKITMTLPRPRITDTYLDDNQTQIVDRATGILRVFDKDLEQNARRKAVDELRLAAGQCGILNDATERARSQLTIFLYQMGFREIELPSK